MLRIEMYVNDDGSIAVGAETVTAEEMRLKGETDTQDAQAESRKPVRSLDEALAVVRKIAQAALSSSTQAETPASQAYKAEMATP